MDAQTHDAADIAIPAVLFLCVHNAGRSQMALGWFNHLASGRAIAWSGGSEPGHEINPAAIEAMHEVGIDITGEFPKPWTDEILRAADVVVTMGCGDECPWYPGKRYEDRIATHDRTGRGLDREPLIGEHAPCCRASVSRIRGRSDHRRVRRFEGRAESHDQRVGARNVRHGRAN